MLESAIWSLEKGFFICHRGGGDTFLSKLIEETHSHDYEDLSLSVGSHSQP